MMAENRRNLGLPRRPSPMGGRKPTRADLARFATDNPDAIDDILPAAGTPLRLLIVGINPGLWTAAVNAPFARPGNRFWPSLFRAGLTDHLVDAAAGLRPADEAQLLQRGIGLTNLVGRATARADELSGAELRAGGARLIARLDELRPAAVAVAGITAFRAAFALPKAQLGRQDSAAVPGWPDSVALWVVPQPSGLNAHENVESLAARWREVWHASASHGDQPPDIKPGPVTLSDHAALAELLASNPEYSRLVSGAPPTAAAAHDALTELPPGVDSSQKYGLGLWQDTTLLAFADVVRGWPDSATTLIGLLMTRGERHRCGLGRRMHDAVLEQVSQWPEISVLRLGIVDVCADQANRFWAALGYTPTGVVKPFESGSIRSTVRVWTRPLGVDPATLIT